MSGTLQGSNSYDVSYTGSSKTTTTELSGSALRDVTLSLNSVQTLTMGSAITLSRNLTIGSGNTLDVSTANNYAINLKGNFTNNGTYTSRSGTVTFNGTSAQTLSGSSSTSFYNATLNN